jgi:hypothetical protein
MCVKDPTADTLVYNIGHVDDAWMLIYFMDTGHIHDHQIQT